MDTTKGLKLIGKGAFTKCYKLNESTVLLKTTDPIKECMAHGWFPESELFPKVEFSAIEQCYEMEFYPKTRSLKNNLDNDQWQIYKDLRALNINHSLNKYDSYNNVYKAFETLENEDLKETMIEALEACGNYGSDIMFEISPRNVAVKKGKLVLLDCFFSISKLNEVRGKNEE